jgi:hypothetical protein
MALVFTSWEASTVQTLESWFSHPAVLWGCGIFSVIAVVSSIVFVPRYLAKLPRDYLTKDEQRSDAGVAGRVARNLLGVVLVVLGVLMLILPGQGILTLLVGVLLVDFPGKHKLVQRLLGRPKVLRVVNKLRARHGSPPLAT